MIYDEYLDDELANYFFKDDGLWTFFEAEHKSIEDKQKGK